ncbi:MAG: xanthine dehydrogenase family protein subunit M [Deltaproteobacteria bacterium]|jgi:carbon-monoxide dehydrogenase medium subunit|nr:xanthine dehydrogenase family protein subunit M [Deltaproteobacteria bacterium]
MQVSRYEAPESLDAAVALLANDNEARVIAGGTDLLVQMRTGGSAPSAFIDIKRIPEMSRLEINSSGLVIGAAVPAARIYANDTIRQLWPGLAEATDLIGSSQIQGRATWSGNLCNASPAADSVPALIATGAEVIVLGPNGERRVPVDGFVTGPGQTVLQPGELVVAFRVPTPAPRSADAYLRLIPRTEMDIAVVGAAVQLTLDADGSVASAMVVLGAVAPTQLRVDAAAAALVGSKLEDAALSAAASAASDAARPIDDKRGTIAYRKKISGVLTRRAARIAYDRAKERN